MIKIILAMAIIASSSACAQKQNAGYEVVNPAEFAKLIDSDSIAYVLDVRTPQEYAEGHISDAHNLDWLNPQAFKSGATALPKVDTIYVYCRSGRRSAEAAEYLNSLGYKVIDLDGGYLAWEQYKTAK